ncbi:MAG: sigma-70 family RNA polymerase sigma factor [Gemmatimonadota bacterium]|nr:sigma-70 family RNA polymerase sigma factor [Gemmatimonadota bacterium]
MALPDSALVALVRAGDAGAYEALVRRHYRAAFAVAMAVARTTMDAEDICQDALLIALERIDACRQPDRFAAWLMQIVRNRAHNVREAASVRATEPLESDTAAASGSAQRDAERSELRTRLERALEGLNERQREVVLLHDLEGWDHRAIARMLSISDVASRQHLFVARRILRERLGPTVLEEYIRD